MTLTLRMRLALLVVCSVALSVGPGAVPDLAEGRRDHHRHGGKELRNLLLGGRGAPQHRLMNHLASKVRGVMARKAQLRDAAARVTAQLRQLPRNGKDARESQEGAA